MSMLRWSLSRLILPLILALCSLTLGKPKIDLQWAICDEDAETVLRKLGHGGQGPYKANNITYYDTLPPRYTAKGVAFRTKVKKHQPISMIKARFNEETENVPPEAGCVWDRYGDATYYTCSLAFPLLNETEDIWSDEQVAFVQRYQQVDFDTLVPYGPFLNPKWKLHIEGYKAVFDDVMAFAGDSPLHLMEIEVAAKMKKSDRVYKTISKLLKSRGVVICEEPQLPKTLRLFNALNASSTGVVDVERAGLSDWRGLGSYAKVDLKH